MKTVKLTKISKKDYFSDIWDLQSQDFLIEDVMFQKRVRMFLEKIFRYNYAELGNFQKWINLVLTQSQLLTIQIW